MYIHTDNALFLPAEVIRGHQILWIKSWGMAVGAMCVVGTEPLFLKEQLVLLMMEPSL